MFLDDKLTEIWETGRDRNEKVTDTLQKLIDECVSRIPDPNTCSVETWINSVKRIDNYFRLFAKRNTYVRPDGFKAVMMRRCGDKEEYNVIYRQLGWLK